MPIHPKFRPPTCISTAAWVLLDDDPAQQPELQGLCSRRRSRAEGFLLPFAHQLRHPLPQATVPGVFVVNNFALSSSPNLQRAVPALYSTAFVLQCLLPMGLGICGRLRAARSTAFPRAQHRRRRLG